MSLVEPSCATDLQRWNDLTIRDDGIDCVVVGNDKDTLVRGSPRGEVTSRYSSAPHVLDR